MAGASSDRLSPGTRLWAGFAAVVIPSLLRVTSFESLTSRLASGRPELGEQSTGFSDVRLASFVDGVLHRLGGPWRHTCLKRSTTLFYLLRAAGRPVEMRIGVRRDDEGRLQAHSWLLLDGALYLEPNEDVVGTHEVIARFGDEESMADGR